MAEKPIKTPLPADLPEDWNVGQTVAPDGTAVGLTEQHGYNYLMAAVNRAQRGVNEVNEAFGTVSGKRTCRFVVGTSTAGWTEADCDYLCDGTDDQVEIQAAINALPSGGGEIVLLDGTYQLNADLTINNQSGNISFRGEAGSTILRGGRLSIGNSQSGKIVIVNGLSFDGVESGISSNNTSLSIKECYFLNSGISFLQSAKDWSSSFLCSGNKFRIDDALGTNFHAISTSINALGRTEMCVISNNIIELIATSTSVESIVSMDSVQNSNLRSNSVFTNNSISCGPRMSKAICKVLINDRCTITGNCFYQCDLVTRMGGEITGNEFFVCSIDAATTDIEGTAIDGNSVIAGGISASGYISVTGNYVSGGNSPYRAAIRILPSLKTTTFNHSPVVVGNFIEYGILLDMSPESYDEGWSAVINSNVLVKATTAIDIVSGWKKCMITDNVIEGSIEDNGTDNIVRFNSDDPSTGGGSGGGGTAGVTTFNGRSGKVVPGNDDYTAAMVGAIPASAVKEIQSMTQSQYDALATKNATTLYLIKE